MVKKLLLYLIVLTASEISIASLDSNINPNIELKIYLDAIKVNKPIKPKDKIYIQVTEYSNIYKSKEYRVPAYPKYWLQRELSELKSIILWHGAVESLEKKELIISLIEQNLFPLDIDASLGSIKLIMDNRHQGQKMLINWEQAGLKENVNIKKIKNKTKPTKPSQVIFEMQGKNSNYLIKLHTVTKLQK
jgi:hypothetical protein